MLIRCYKPHQTSHLILHAVPGLYRVLLFDALWYSTDCLEQQRIRISILREYSFSYIYTLMYVPVYIIPTFPQYMRSRKLPRELQTKIQSYFAHLYSTTKARSTPEWLHDYHIFITKHIILTKHDSVITYYFKIHICLTGFGWGSYPSPAAATPVQ